MCATSAFLFVVLTYKEIIKRKISGNKTHFCVGHIVLLSYFADPENNYWEVAWNPNSVFDERGAMLSF